jgi:hypothetical protein
VYFPLDEELVKRGRWRDCAEILLAQNGYQSFVTREMLERHRVFEDKDNLSSMSGSVKTWEDANEDLRSPLLGGKGLRSASELRKEREERQRQAEERRRAKLFEQWRQTMLASEFRMLRRAGGLSAVRGRWEELVVDREEVARLRKLQQKRREPERLPWVSTSCVGAGQGSRVRDKRSPTRVQGARGEGKEGPTLAAGGLDGRQELEPSGSVERMRAASEVVDAMLRMEKQLEEVKGVLASCVVSYKACRLQKDRLELLDEVTASLGHPQVCLVFLPHA